MPAREASNGNDNAPALLLDDSADDATASADDGDPTRGQAIVRAVAAGVCVGATMLLAELGNDRARALLGRPAPRTDNGSAPPSEVMSADQAAAFLGVDRNTVYDAAGRGEIPHRRIGKRILFSRAQLVAWLGACKGARVGNG